MDPSGGRPVYDLVSARHTNEVGEDIETVQVALLSAEYPARPAEANRFLNTSPDVVKRYLTGGIRGCIIAAIAEQHAKYEAYGPKGGPYDIGAIETDALAHYNGRAKTCSSILYPARQHGCCRVHFVSANELLCSAGHRTEGIMSPL